MRSCSAQSELTGVEAGPLRVQGPVTLNGEHPDRVQGAWCQAVEVVGQIPPLLRQLITVDLYLVMADVARPGLPGQSGAAGGHVGRLDAALEMICDWKKSDNCDLAAIMQ